MTKKLGDLEEDKVTLERKINHINREHAETLTDLMVQKNSNANEYRFSDGAETKESIQYKDQYHQLFKKIL